MDNSKEILSILNDDESRNILKTLLSEELTIQQISSKLNISQSSAYRKIRKLEDAGLIKKSKVIRTQDGSDENYYKSMVYQITVLFKNGELSLTIEKFKMEDKIVRMWEKFSKNNIQS